MVALVSILAVAVGLLTLLVAGLLRSHAEILRSLQSLGVTLDPDHVEQPASPTGLTSRDADTETPQQVTGVDPVGAPVSFAIGGVSHRTLLAFLSSTCLTCRGFWNAFADRHLAVPGGARLLVITKGSEAESPGTIRKLAPAGVHTILSSDAWRDFNIPVAPFFVLVDGTTNKVIGEGAASTWEQVSDLMAQSLVDLDDAGMHTNASTRPTLGRAQDRPSRVDADLRAAGIEPGHPSLHPGRDG